MKFSLFNASIKERMGLALILIIVASLALLWAIS